MTLQDSPSKAGVASVLWPVRESAARMLEIDYARGDRGSYFAALFFQVFSNICDDIEATGPGAFAQPMMAARVGRQFHQRTFDAWDAAHHGRACSPAWRLAFEANGNDRLCVLQQLLVSLAPHVIYDLPLSLSDSLQRDEMTPFQPDFVKINQAFSGLFAKLFDGLAQVNPELQALVWAEGHGLKSIIDTFMEVARGISWDTAEARQAASPAGRAALDAAVAAACIGLQETVLARFTPLGLLFEQVRRHESGDVRKNARLIYDALHGTSTSTEAGLDVPHPPKRRVVILGAGVAGLSTAAYLTDPRNLTSGNTEVTVYQLGWRAGGKGATGRSQEPGQGERIQEHGLHAFFGFYENAFRLVHDVYAELKPSVIPTWREAFEPVVAGLYWEPVGAPRTPWRVGQAEMLDPSGEVVMPGALGVEGSPSLLPSWLELPGVLLATLRDQFAFAATDPQDPLHVPAKEIDALLSNVMALFHIRASEPTGSSPDVRVVGNLPQRIQSLAAELGRPAEAFASSLRARVAGLIRKAGEVLAHPGEARQRVGRLLHAGRPSSSRTLPQPPPADLTPNAALLTDSLRRLQELGHKHLLAPNADRPAEVDDTARRLWIMINFGTAALRGIVADDVTVKGVEVINHLDFREWLSAHLFEDGGVTLNSALMRAVYDASFAYVGGDMTGAPFPTAAKFEAGTALHGALRAFLTYHGAFGFKMRAGTGDSVVAPIYRLLRRRGVNFRFFRVARDITLEPGTGRIASITLDPQARVLAEKYGGQYEPLYNVKGLPCWPDRPWYDQLDNGTALVNIDLEDPNGSWPKLPPETLTVDTDFDDVVLAMPPAASESIVGPLRSQPVWGAMFANVDSVRTQAMQTWLKKTPEALGLKPEAIDGRPVTVFWNQRGNGLNVMSDYRTALEFETWSGPETPQSVIYHCSVMTETDSLATVKATGIGVLNGEAPVVYGPGAGAPGGGFAWDLLVAPPGTPPDRTRFDHQFWKQNTTPSERYVLSVPKSSRHRLPAWLPTSPNLYLAGDWTRNVLNCGCMEGTVISGMLAANVLSTWPPRDLIVGANFGAGLFGNGVPLLMPPSDEPQPAEPQTAGLQSAS